MSEVLMPIQSPHTFLSIDQLDLELNLHGINIHPHGRHLKRWNLIIFQGNPTFRRGMMFHAALLYINNRKFPAVNEHAPSASPFSTALAGRVLIKNGWHIAAPGYRLIEKFQQGKTSDESLTGVRLLNVNWFLELDFVGSVCLPFNGTNRSKETLPVYEIRTRDLFK